MSWPWFLFTNMGPAAVTGTTASTLPILTAALAGTETYSGNIASTLPVLTSALVGTELIAGTVNTVLPVVTSALAAVSIDPVTGEIAAILPSLNSALDGFIDNPIGLPIEVIDVGGPVYPRRVYEKIRKKRQRKRPPLAAIKAELEQLQSSGITPPLNPEPYLLRSGDRSLAGEVDALLAALKAAERQALRDWQDDEDAILALIKAA